MDKILIVTNQKLMCNEYAFLLEKYVASENVRKATCSIEALSLLKRDHFALAIIDMNNKDSNGLELFLMLAGKTQATKVLMVNVRPEDKVIFEMHRLGVTGLLSMKADGDEFVEAIGAMMEKGKYFSAVLAEKIFFYGAKYIKLIRHRNLTMRELQIMIMLGKGWAIKDIAERIYLSGKTISTYKSRIYQKMEFENSSELIGYLLSCNFL